MNKVLRITLRGELEVFTNSDLAACIRIGMSAGHEKSISRAIGLWRIPGRRLQEMVWTDIPMQLQLNEPVTSCPEGKTMNRKQFRKARVAVKLDRINNTATCDVPGYEKALILELMHRK